MATIAGIAATTSALLRLLSDDLPPGLGVGGIEAHDPAAPGSGARLVLWLYRGVPVPALRTRPMAGSVPPAEPRAGVRAAAVALDLHYLLWTRGVAPAAQQTAYAWALRRVADSPILTAERLNQGAVVFRPQENVAVQVEELPLAEYTALTAPLGHALALPLRARGIQIDGR